MAGPLLDQVKKHAKIEYRADDSYVYLAIAPLDIGPMISPPTMESIKKMKWLAGNGSKEQGFSMYTENKENGS